MSLRRIRLLVLIIILVAALPTNPTPPIAYAATDCATQTDIPQTECEALVALYTSTNGAGWSNNTGWNITNTPCSWYGVTCSGGNVTGIELHQNGLSGAIPAEVGNLANLTDLDLYGNQLSSIPTEVGNLANLTSLHLDSNQLSSIPAEVGNLTNLTSLDLSWNQLSSIPAEVGNLTNLTFLSLNSNQLSSIPAEVGSLTNLTSLWLLDNQLSSIPAEVGSLTNLTSLWLHNNQLSSIPAEVGNLTNLTYLSLHNNQLSSIPAEVGNLANLTTLYLSWNQLSSIPAEVGNLANLTTLYLSWNQLSSIPAEVGNLANLTFLYLNNNQLSSIPAEVGNLTNLTTLYLNNNYLSGTPPTELTNLTNLSSLDLGNNWLTTTGLDPTLDTFLLEKDPDWKDTQTPLCTTQTEIPQAECEALVMLYTSTNGANWTTNTDWLATTTPCSWHGVTCAGGHVTELNLFNNQLSGAIPSELGNLTNLQTLDLAYNQLSSVSPELGNLANLGILSVRSNNLITVPPELGNLTNLVSLDLAYNQLSSVSPELGNLTNLQVLNMTSNQLSGTIPPELANLTNLGSLGLSSNQLSGGIPSELGNLTNLQHLALGDNQLSGGIPSELGTLTNLIHLYLNDNQLSGEIPSELGNLANLTDLSLANNQLSGAILSELGSLSNLTWFKINNNYLSGTPPTELTNLTNLTSPDVDLGNNCLTTTGLDGTLDTFLLDKDPDWKDTQTPLCTTQTEIPQAECEALVAFYTSTDGANWTTNTDWLATTTPCSWYGVTCAGGHVTGIAMVSNQLSGTIPSELGNLTNLQTLHLYDNQLSGAIPTEFGNLANLKWLRLDANELSGAITELGDLTNLQGIELQNNQFSGVIPLELGNLTNLQGLMLYNNQLSGSIPSELGSLANLEDLGLTNNQLSGTIPPELGNLTNLQEMWLQRNNLSGSIPSELGNLTNLTRLELNDNDLSGSIPPELGNLNKLTDLWLYNNLLSGAIPPELGSLANLTELNLNNNYLRDMPPTQLTNLTNLSQPNVDLGNNCLTTTGLDGTLDTFLLEKDPDWKDTQCVLPTLSIANPTPIAEGNDGTQTLAFPVTLSAAAEITITVDWATEDGTATTADNDYVAGSGTLTFVPGVTEQTASVTINGDTAVEEDETVLVNLSNATVATIANAQATGTINNDDSATLSIAAPTPIDEGNTGTQTLTFPVTLSAAAEITITVDWATEDGTATTADNDYVAGSGTLTFAPGITEQTVSVTINGDTKVEPNETVLVNLSNATVATIANAQATGTIQNDDIDVDLPIISLDDVEVTEGDSGTVSAEIPVQLSQASTGIVTVDYTMQDGTATANATDTSPSDYTASSSTLTFQPGTTVQTATVSINGDTWYEPDETFSVILSNAQGATIAVGAEQATITIRDNETVAFSIDDVDAQETDGEALYIISAAGASHTTLPITLTLSTTDGTATNPEDYGTPTPELLTFAAGALNAQTVSVSIIQDDQGEPNETYTVDISLDGTYDNRVSISKANGNGVIVDSTTASFSISDATASESDDAIIFTVSATGASNLSENVSLKVETVNGTAQRGIDFGTPATTTLSFGDGNMGDKKVRVPIKADTINELNETFAISMSLDRDYRSVTVSDSEGIGTIQDDDPITFGIQDVQGNKADPNIIFTVAITGASESVQTIKLLPSITDGTAKQGVDIGAPQPATIVLTAGNALTHQPIAIPILENVQTDRERTFTLNLALGAAYSSVTLNRNAATGTIIDDGIRRVNFSAPEYHVNESDGQATINVTLRPPINEEVRVDYTVAEAADMANAATANDDFTPTSGTLVFASGETSKQFTVAIAEDSLDEYAEPISLSLANPSNAEIGSSGNATLFISEDPSDQPPTVQFDQATYREYEDIGVALIPVQLNYASGKTISVPCNTQDGTATSPDDYTPPEYAVTFAPGTTEKSCRVPIFNDVLNEDDETLTLSLAVDDTDSVLLGNLVDATFTIADDNDPLPIVTPSIDKLQICESAGTVPVTITLNTTSGKTVQVEYSTINGTATTDDYTFQRDTITFAAQQTTQVINIPITPDNLYEQPDEHFWLGLRTAEGADIGNVEAARITIVDADIHGVCGVPGVQFAQEEYTANEYDATATFTLTLSKPSEQPITVLYDTVAGTATPYGDYKPKSSSVTFAPGEMSKPVVVTLVDDKDVEGTVEMGMQVRLGESEGAVRLGEPALATLNILDDDAPPQGALHFSKATYRTSEDSRHMVITVERTGGSEGTVTIDYATLNDNAQAGLDYEASQGTLTFGPGEVEHTFVVSITDDVKVEGDERINLHLSNPTGGAALGKQHDAVLIIIDDEEEPHGVLAFTSPSYDTNEDSKTATVYVQRTSGNTGTVTVEYSTFDKTATAGSDYTAVKGVLTFSPTQTMQSFPIPIIDDATFEGNETIDLRLSNPTGGAVLGSTQEAVLEIVDNPPPPEGIVEFAQDTYEVREDAGEATINIYRTGLEGTMRVDYTTLEQSATAGNDYTKRSGTLTFAPGHTKASFTIPIANDTTIEGNETVQLQLKNVVGGHLGTRQVATLIIIDDVPKAGLVQFHTDTYEVNEGDTQTTIAVERTGGFDEQITVDYAAYPYPDINTAIAGSDYLTSSGTLTFPPGSGTQVFTVTILEDTEMEGNETIQLRLSNVQSTIGTQLGNANATLTIVDNDLPPEGMLQFSAVEYFVNEEEISATITVERKSGFTGMVSVSYATADGSATLADNDYESRSGELTFQPYDTHKTFSVPIITDANIEGDEDISLILENATGGAWLGKQNEATLIIKDCQECASDNEEDTEPAGVLQFDPVHEQIHENSGVAMMTVRRVSGDHGEVQVDYETLPNGGTATADTDYQPTKGTLTFDEGITERTFPVNIMDDNNVELDETITLSLTHATNGATIGSNGTAVLTIVENDLPVVRFVAAFGEEVSSDIQVDEDVGSLELPVQLSMKVENTIVVTYTTTWNDELPLYHTLTFSPSVTIQTIAIAIEDNITLEPDETLTVELQSATNGMIGNDHKRVITIRDDDGPARVAMQPMHTWLVADGKSTTVVTTTVYDRRDYPVANHCVAFSTTSGQVAPITAQTNATGVATTTLTSSATPSLATVKAESCTTASTLRAHAPAQPVAPASSRVLQDVAPTSSRIRQDAGATTQQNDVSGATTVVFGYLNTYLPFISSTPGPYRTYMVFDTDTPVVRVGSAATPTNITLQAVFADYISPAANTTVKLQTSLGTFDNGQKTMSTQTDKNGNVTFDLYPGEVAGTAIVSASIQTEKLFGEDALEVGFAGVPIQATMEATAQRLPLAGNTTVAATLYDAYDNPVPQQEVTFSTDQGTIELASATTDTTGRVETPFDCPASESKSAATVSVSTAGFTEDIQLVCGAPELLTLSATPEKMEARIANTSTINATVQDVNKAMIAGQEVLFTANAGMLSVAQSTTNATNGTATTTLHNPTLLTGKMTVLAQADGLTETVAIEITPVELPNDQVGNSIARPGIFPSLDAAYGIATNANADADNTDYYRFDVHGEYTVTLHLRTIPNGADYDLSLVYASRRVSKGESRNSGNADEHLALRLTRGAYYVRVHKQVPAPSTKGGYTLAVVAKR